MSILFSGFNLVSKFCRNLPGDFVDRRVDHIKSAANEIQDRSYEKFKYVGDGLSHQAGQISRATKEVLVFTGRELSRLTQLSIGLGAVISLALVTNFICKGHEDEASCQIATLASRVVLVGAMGLSATMVYESLPDRARLNFGPKVTHSPFYSGSELPRLSAETTDLIEAAHKGDLEKIILLQKQGVFLEAQDATGKTALHWAVIGNHTKVIEQLWFFGCNFNITDKDHQLPIHFTRKQTPLHTLCSQLMTLKNRFSFESPIYLFYPPEYLVFKGGGVKGIAYVGIQQYMEERGLLRELKGVAGTSAGAINATLVALGYTSEDLEKILGGMDPQQFLDHAYQKEQDILSKIASAMSNGGKVTLNECLETFKKVSQWYYSSEKQKTPIELITTANLSGGFCEGKNILNWIEALIVAKTKIPNCTFGEYRKLLKSTNFKHIYIYATRIDPEVEIVCFNSEDSQWDDVLIADAVRASMSIPLVFVPHTLRTKTKNGILSAPEFGKFIDGGLIKNLPIDHFDSEKYQATNRQSKKSCENHQTLALNFIDSSETKAETTGRTTASKVAKAALNVFASGEEILLKKNISYQQRMIDIDNLGIGLVSGFFASKETHQKLIKAAKQGAHNFFEKQKVLAKEHAAHDPARILSIVDSRYAEFKSIDIDLKPEKETSTLNPAPITESLPPPQKSADSASVQARKDRNQELIELIKKAKKDGKELPQATLFRSTDSDVKIEEKHSTSNSAPITEIFPSDSKSAALVSSHARKDRNQELIELIKKAKKDGKELSPQATPFRSTDSDVKIEEKHHGEPSLATSEILPTVSSISKSDKTTNLL